MNQTQGMSINLKESQYDKRVELHDAVPLKAPLSIYLSPVNICNFRCVFCEYQNKLKKGFEKIIWDVDVVKRITDDIKRSFVKVKSITFTSAETLLNNNIPEMIATVKSVCDKTRVITNGSLLTNELSDKLIASGLDYLTISVNGLSDADYLTNTGHKLNFDLFIEQIRYLYENKAHLKITAKIFDYMIKGCEEKFALIFGGIVDYLEVQSLEAASEEIDYLSIVDSEYKFDKSLTGRILSEKSKICTMAFYTLNIRENGDVVPCCPAFIDAPVLGNIHKTDLKDIWDSSICLQQIMLKDIHQIPKCAKCNTRKYRTGFDSDCLDEFSEQLIPRYDKAVRNM